MKPLACAGVWAALWSVGLVPIHAHAWVDDGLTGVTPSPATQALFDRPVPPLQPTWNPPAPAALPGIASVYHRKLHGRLTASGEPYANEGWTAAHRDLPLGTLLSVTNPASGVEVVVRVNDRGPHHPGRMLDLSVAAAQALGLLRSGVALVVMRPLLSDEAALRPLGVQAARP